MRASTNATELNRSLARGLARLTSTEGGILRPEELASHAEVTRAPCSAALSPWVENHWSVRWDLPPGTTYVSSVLPHPACTLSVELGHPRPGVGDDRVVVTGVVTERFDVPLAGRGWVLGVKFRPGALAALCRLDARRLTDRVVPAFDVLAAPIAEGLRAIPFGTPVGQAGALAEAALAPLVADACVDRGYETVLAMIDDLLADHELVRVADLAARHGVSRRHVERLFARYVGVTPKWVVARYRMHDVVRSLDDGHTGTLAELAARLGWFDQPHFSRDFIDQVGTTPSAYRDRRRADHPSVGGRVSRPSTLR